MATITVEGIPNGLLARLRLAADGSGHTLSREVVVQLARSVGCAREHPRPRPVRMGARCAEGGGCRCIARRVKARGVGWGGPA